MKLPLFSALRRLGASAFITLAALAGMSGEAQALSCPAGKVQQGGLCFEPAKSGYSCNGPVCQEDCRSGYSPSLPGFCHYRGSPTYTENPFLTKKSSHPHKCGAFWYGNCRQGYRMDLCGICGYKGAWDTTRAVYTRAGSLPPDYSAAFTKVASVSQATYGSSLGVMQSGYYSAAAAVQSGIDAVTLRMFVAAAKSAYGSSTVTKVKQAAISFAALDADLLNSMQEVLLLVASKKDLALAEQQRVAEVLTKVGKAIGLYSDAVAVSSAKADSNSSMASAVGGNGSFGIQFGAAGAYVAGVNSSFAIVVNGNKDADGKLQMRVISSIGGSLGASWQVSAGVGLLWSPKSVDKAAGPYIGVVGAGESPAAGISFGPSWDIARGMRGAQNAIPGYQIEVGLGAGFPLSLSLVAGNTTELAAFSVLVP